MSTMENENTEEKEQDIVSQGVHNYSAAETYCRPAEPILQEKLEWFQDQKLALMMHWGLYCELGMVASWALSDKDAEWSRHQVNWTEDKETFKKQYFGLNKSFNPVRFQPEEWAQMAEDCGFRYLLLTTKHHDGFCLWDTAYTDYKVTAKDCPFHENEHADIVKSMFDAFREKGIGIGAYFSKADWHCPDYWNPELRKDGLTSRGPSYDPKEYPEIWSRFQEFTKNQVLELCRNYGKLDILWFDAGWVCKANGQDIDLGGIVDEDLRRSHLRNQSLRSLPERQSLLYPERGYRLCDPPLSSGTGSCRVQDLCPLHRQDLRDPYAGQWKRGCFHGSRRRSDTDRSCRISSGKCSHRPCI